MEVSGIYIGSNFGNGFISVFGIDGTEYRLPKEELKKILGLHDFDKVKKRDYEHLMLNGLPKEV